MEKKSTMPSCVDLFSFLLTVDSGKSWKFDGMGEPDYAWHFPWKKDTLPNLEHGKGKDDKICYPG